MPRISKKVPRHRAKLTSQQTFQLLTGFCYFSHERLEGEVLALAWEAWGETLTGLHVSLYPCTRPHAWWMFGAPEAWRRCLNMPHHPFDDPRYPSYARKLSFGVPCCYFVSPVGSKEMPWNDAVFEPQEEYLRRHRLLSSDERRKGSAWHWPDDRLTQDPYLSLAQVREWYSDQA